MFYVNTNIPHSFFLQNTICIRKPQVILGGGGGGGLRTPHTHPPRSAPRVGVRFQSNQYCYVLPT